MAGAALVVFGVHVWQIVRELEQNYRPILGRAEILASSLVETLWQSGTIAALAVIPYLLAPKAAVPDGARALVVFMAQWKSEQPPSAPGAVPAVTGQTGPLRAPERPVVHYTK